MYIIFYHIIAVYIAGYTSIIRIQYNKLIIFFAELQSNCIGANLSALGHGERQEKRQLELHCMFEEF